MRNPERLDKLYSTLLTVHKEAFSDIRAFQLFGNFMGWVYEKTKRDPFFIEDGEFEKLIKEYGEIYGSK